MLAQFQSRYPTGSLISELLQIHQGKFLVRVAVQVDQVTRATGLAAADTIEEAEDRARERALMVLMPGVNVSVSAQLPQSQLAQVQPDSGFELPIATNETNFVPNNHLELLHPTTFAPELQDAVVDTHGELLFKTYDYSDQNLSAPDEMQSHPMVEKVKEPVDLSDTIAQTTLELKRLGWNNRKGRDYLVKTCGKQTRQELSEEELLEFLAYLKSQPTPM